MVSSATPEEREKLWVNIVEADKFWIAVSLILGLLSHASRAYRWKFLLEPLGYKPKFYNSFMAVMVAYLANLGIPRSGEVLRGATISTYEKVPFEKAFGTIVSERIADLIMLLLVVATAILLQTDTLLNYFNDQDINPLMAVGIIVLLVVGVLVGVRILKSSTHKFFVKLRTFAEGLLDGMKSILHMKNKWAFIFHTVFIWLSYVLMFGVIKY
ncbi:MAG TPA: TIGR00374 family protein, partial [Flavobacteriaceae bacterium]|nr:TIGR00374 family protein [Flavobacteriaceae bacterium]